MAALTERVSGKVTALREQHPVVDRTVAGFGHYGRRNGDAQAGAVTFYAFLSFFPLLALAFFVVGWLSAVYPDARRELIDALEEILPGLIGSQEGEIPLETVEEYAGTVGRIGAVGLLYAGLGWVAAMRTGLATMFDVPEREQPGFLAGRLHDLVALVVLGVVLVVSVSLSGAVTWSSGAILRWVGLDELVVAEVVLWLVAHGLAIAATTILFVALFGLVENPHLARRALWQGALLGAVGFEVLKSLAGWLISLTKEQPAFQAFGVALILLVWINYFSRLVMLSASWAYTAPVAEELRALEHEPLVSAEESEALVPAPAAVVAEDPAGSPLPQALARRASAERIGRASVLAAGSVAALTWLARRRSQ